MPFCENEGNRLYYEVEGDGPDVVLLHCWGDNLEFRWRTLTKLPDVLGSEYRLIMLELRGHGRSDKPRDSCMYGGKMLGDILCVMDELRITKANFVGCSLGAWLCLQILLTHPERMTSAVLSSYILPDAYPPKPTLKPDYGVEALLADDSAKVDRPVERYLREQFISIGGDLKALAALKMGVWQNWPPEVLDPGWVTDKLRHTSIPLLTITGTKDKHLDLGNPTRLANTVSNGWSLIMSGCSHNDLMNHNPGFLLVVKAFLDWVNRRFEISPVSK